VPLFTSGGFGFWSCYYGLGLKNLVLFTSLRNASSARWQCRRKKKTLARLASESTGKTTSFNKSFVVQPGLLRWQFSDDSPISPHNCAESNKLRTSRLASAARTWTLFSHLVYSAEFLHSGILSNTGDGTVCMRPVTLYGVASPF